MIGIDVSEIYKKLGLEVTTPVVYKVSQKKNSSPVITYNIPDVEVMESNILSYLGTPILFPITFVGGTYDINNNGKIEEITLSDFILPGTTIATFNARKEAAKSVVNGGNSQIIEVWSDLIWDLTIKGFTLSGTGTETEDVIRQLVEFARVKDVEVRADIFEWLNINRLFIDSLNLNQNQGYGDMVSFTMNAVKTEPFELII